MASQAFERMHTHVSIRRNHALTDGNHKQHMRQRTSGESTSNALVASTRIQTVSVLFALSPIPKLTTERMAIGRLHAGSGQIHASAEKGDATTGDSKGLHTRQIPPGTLVFTIWLSVLCMRSKAWLAARVSLRLARLPRTASSAQHSRRLRSTRAAAPILLAHAEVTKTIILFSMGPKLR